MIQKMVIILYFSKSKLLTFVNRRLISMISMKMCINVSNGYYFKIYYSLKSKIVLLFKKMIDSTFNSATGTNNVPGTVPYEIGKLKNIIFYKF